ncbi:sensor histidine kinase [Methylobacterium iners]|nr:sensor histidine kinase [Methylobacterium iners]
MRAVPHNWDFNALFEFVSNPILILRFDGVVEAANRSAHETLAGVEVGSVLSVLGSGDADELLRFLRRCSTTNATVPGALHFRTGDEVYERLRCHGARVQLQGFGGGPLILLHLHSDGLDRRFKILAAKLHDARMVMQERRRRVREMQALLTERERLLARLEEDAAARRSAEHERDVVLARLYRAGQDERKRLARDLHDHAGQHLVALNFGLRRLTPHLKELQARTDLEHLLKQAQDVGEALRRVTLALRPAALDEFGFVTALRHLIGEWSRFTETTTEFGVVGEEITLSTEVAITLYRLTQEALTNAAKHAGCPSLVSIVLRYSPDQITLMIDDNGSGFEADAASGKTLVAQGKLGLIGMRERLALVGGGLDIESAPGSGTSIVARVRLNGSQGNDA